MTGRNVPRAISTWYPALLHLLCTPMTADAHTVATAWLSYCSSSLCNGDIDAFTSLFLSTGWLRDLLIFSWDIRSLEGRHKISTYLSRTILAAQVTDIRLVTDIAELAPRTFAIPHTRATGVELTFRFACRNGRGRGNARLLRDMDGAYRAITVLTELADLHGHEEARVPLSESSGAFATGDPYVLIGEPVECTVVISRLMCLNSRSCADGSPTGRSLQAHADIGCSHRTQHQDR